LLSFSSDNIWLVVIAPCYGGSQIVYCVFWLISRRRQSCQWRSRFNFCRLSDYYGIFPTYGYQFDDNALSRPNSFHLWTTSRTSCLFVLHTACHTIISYRITSEHRRGRHWTKQHSASHSSHHSVSHIQVKQDNYSHYNN